MEGLDKISFLRTECSSLGSFTQATYKEEEEFAPRSFFTFSREQTKLDNERKRSWGANEQPQFRKCGRDENGECAKS